ncbi:MAG: helix-turn-helix domain-containing protein [Acidimicrobiales bacterium]
MVDLDPRTNPTLSVDEAAAVLGISRSSAFAAAHRGEIPTVRFGRRMRVPTAALRHLLSLGRIEGGDAA